MGCSIFLRVSGSNWRNLRAGTLVSSKCSAHCHFAWFFVVTAARCGLITLIMGWLVELTEGVTGRGNCRLRDLVPDGVGALIAAMAIVLWGEVFSFFELGRRGFRRSGMSTTSRTMRMRGCLAMVLLLAATVQAQSTITGKWEGTTRNGFQVVLDLKADGDVLTGTVTREGEASPIQEGKISKKTFTFKAVLGDETESLTGESGEEQLKVWLDRQGPEGAVVFKRAKQ